MSWGRMISKSQFKNNPKSIYLNFITNVQFAALKRHFGSVLESMKDDENLLRVRIEFSKLLDVFMCCFLENVRKTRKIFELTARNTVGVKQEKNADPMQEAIMKDLRVTINHLQKVLDETNEERMELLKEIRDLKTTVDTQDKLIPFHSKSLETLPQDKNSSPTLTSELKIIKDNTVAEYKYKEVNHFDRKNLENSLKEEDNMTDAKVLKNNINILVADLKITRHKIEELKADLSKKENLVMNFSKNLSRSEALLNEAQSQVVEIKKPIEIKLEKCKMELVETGRKLEGVSKQLEKALDNNTKLAKDVSSKDSIIEILNSKIKDLELEKEIVFRKTEMFEKELAKNQCYIEDLKHDIEIQNEAAMVPKIQISSPVIQKTSPTDRKRLLEINTQEKTIDSLKKHISLRDQKLHQREEELQSSVELWKSLKKDFNSVTKEKTSLESEIQIMKKSLVEKTGDIKQLKEQLNEDKKEMVTLKKELQRLGSKYQQSVEKKHKFHTMYNKLKVVSNQQKNENIILRKREQYLVQILKEKDLQIEKIVTSKRLMYKV